MNRYRALVWMLRKARAALDRPLSSLELSAMPIEIEEDLTYQERVIVREFAWILADGCSTVFDVGASTGRYAGAFSKVSSVKHVVAFEPLHEVFIELERNTQSQKKVMALNIALGDSNAERDMFHNDFSPSSSLLEMADVHVQLFPHTGNVSTERVHIATLDTVMETNQLPRPDLIKLDVQGYELHVLRGAQKTLGATKYVVTEVNLIDLYEGMARFEELSDLLRPAGFEFRGVIDDLRAGETSTPVAVDAVFVNGNRRAFGNAALG